MGIVRDNTRTPNHALQRARPSLLLFESPSESTGRILGAHSAR